MRPQNTTGPTTRSRGSPDESMEGQCQLLDIGEEVNMIESDQPRQQPAATLICTPQQGGHNPRRPTNITLPQFDGRTSAWQWWHMFSSYVAMFHFASDAEAINHFPFNVAEPVRVWFFNLAAEYKASLGRFKEAFIKRFSTSDPYNTDAFEIKQKETETVNDYLYRVQIVTMDTDLAEDVKVSLAMRGLRADLAASVFRDKPRTLDDLREAGKTAERISRMTTRPMDDLAKSMEAMMVTAVQSLENKLSAKLESSVAALGASVSAVRTKDTPSEGPIGPQVPQFQRSQFPPFQRAPMPPSQRGPGQPRCPGCGKFGASPLTLSLMCMLVLVSMTAADSSTEEIISRLNYGTIFKKDTLLYISKEHWLHTYRIELPVVASIEAVSSCSKDHQYCHLFNGILSNVHMLHEQVHASLSETVLMYRYLIPHFHEADFARKSRKSRSLLPFIGSLSRGLFGTATMDDVNMLKSKINALTRVSNTMVHTLKQHGDHMASFVDVLDNRTSNLLEGIKSNSKEIQFLADALKEKFNTFQETFSNVSNFLILQIFQATQLVNKFSVLQASLQSLVQGKLSPILIPKDAIAASIHHIGQLLAKSYPKFSLIHRDVAYYYEHANFIYARHHSSLFIAIKFPVSTFSRPLTLFKIVSLPVPTNASSQHATKLTNVPDYFAVTHERAHFALLDSSDLKDCTKTSHLFCPFNIPLHPITITDCMVALFSNDRQMIKKVCDFSYVPNLLKPNIIELSPTYVLLYNIERVSLDCPNQKVMRKGCKFCIFHLPCQCTLSTTTMYFSPRLVNCQKSTSNVSVLYPVNLALLQQFFDEEKLEHIFGNTTFVKPVDLIVPEFKIYNHSFSKFLAIDQQQHLSLKRISAAAKKDEKIFKSLSEPLLDGIISLNSDWPDLNTLLTFVTMGFTAIALTICVWAVCKIRKLCITLLVLQQSINAQSSDIPSFVYKKANAEIETEANNVFDFDRFISEFSWVHASVITSILVLIFFIIAIIFVYQYRRKRSGTCLYLEVTSGGQCVLIQILQLPLCPSYWHITVPEILDISLSGLPASKMHAIWRNFSVTNKLTNKSVQVPEQIDVSLFQRAKLSKIIRQPFTAYILIGHHHMYTLLQEQASSSTI